MRIYSNNASELAWLGLAWLSVGFMCFDLILCESSSNLTIHQKDKSIDSSNARAKQSAPKNGLEEREEEQRQATKTY